MLMQLICRVLQGPVLTFDSSFCVFVSYPAPTPPGLDFFFFFPNKFQPQKPSSALGTYRTQDQAISWGLSCFDWETTKDSK